MLKNKDQEKYLNNSIINAFNILECFNEQNTALSYQEISKIIDLSSSSVWRLVQTLEYLGYLEKLSNENKYKLSFKALNFAKVILNSNEIRITSFQYLKELSEKINVNTNLAVLMNEKAFLISRVNSFADPFFHVGTYLPLYCSSLGKLFLAFQNEEKREELIKKLELKKLTPNTITNKEELRENLEIIRSRGYSIDNEEYVNNTKCLSVPVRDSSGEIVAGVGISTRNLPNKIFNIEKYCDEVFQTSEKISRELGFSIYNPLY